jgi:predicted lipoprotein
MRNLMKKIIKYILLLLVIGWVGFKSVYIKKLSEVKKTNDQKFDAVAFSRKLWDEKLPARLDSAVGFVTLIEALKINPADAFERYSNAMGIGNYRYSLVKLTGTAAEIKEDEIIMQTNHGDSLIKIILATEYVYGNAIRDASGLMDIKDFTNTTDLNSISEQLNATVRTVVLPPFKKSVKQGDKIEATGAIEINKEHLRLTELELIPVRLKILP